MSEECRLSPIGCEQLTNELEDCFHCINFWLSGAGNCYEHGSVTLCEDFTCHLDTKMKLLSFFTTGKRGWFSYPSKQPNRLLSVNPRLTVLYYWTDAPFI